ncbi:MAG TPA: acyl-CoA thioesterase [Polyangiaceae bacterium]|nr:acyl-CoA thioesterase [Polyangiaceae bacterium]
MKPRSPGSSRVEMTQIVMPTHTNGASGVLFGGMLMQWIDVCAAVSAMRHCGGAAVTASIDRLDFLVPIHVGDVVVLQSQVNFASRTSMEVGCRVETENPRTGKRRYTTKAYLTFVATDAEGRPREVPPVLPKTKEDKRRFENAKVRREHRLVAAGKLKSAPEETPRSGVPRSPRRATHRTRA